ncbi:hypothetical protein LJ656_17840 [Paraburkholderia sp. MMS20-SJTR3]|uniref:Lauroyl/myristoyl acyltransferase n=1 Tax=Paraburkholderia sejongensis TaxID=2886946 RepID=A0ABS8JX31_9BURK|nr:hypothetical protein [Paraburkholderia sp. MMS20-SJTR3]MCC8394461.1 hypothetical protein [Paraburkholderia sp. MMS20-SJTR3]
MRSFSSRLRRNLRYAKYRCQRAVLARVPASLLEPLAAAGARSGALFSAKRRANGVVRADPGPDLADLAPRETRRARTSRALEHLIDRRIYFGRHVRGVEHWPDLQAVAAKLAQQIARLRQTHPGCPVIVSPFHYVSQYANIYVIDELRAQLALRSLAVVSGMPRNLYGNDQAQIPGVNVLYTFDDDNRGGLGLRVVRSLKRNGALVLFADVPPFTMHRYPMETVGVQMFGRNARIHHGVFRLGAPLNAWLLPFYLTFERGRFDAELFEPLPLAAPDAPQQVADCIATALRANYGRWLAAGHPSLYAFAASR